MIFRIIAIILGLNFLLTFFLEINREIRLGFFSLSNLLLQISFLLASFLLSYIFLRKQKRENYFTEKILVVTFLLNMAIGWLFTIIIFWGYHE